MRRFLDGSGEVLRGMDSNILRPFLQEAKLERCPHCGARRFTRHGWFGSTQRFRCKECRRTFSEASFRLDRGIRLRREFHLYRSMFGRARPLRKEAEKLGVSASTVWRWRHRVLDHLVAWVKAHPKVLDGKIAFITQSRTNKRSRWSNDLDIMWRHRGAPLPKEIPKQPGTLTFVFAARVDGLLPDEAAQPQERTGPPDTASEVGGAEEDYIDWERYLEVLEEWLASEVLEQLRKGGEIPAAVPKGERKDAFVLETDDAGESGVAQQTTEGDSRDTDGLHLPARGADEKGGVDQGRLVESPFLCLVYVGHRSPETLGEVFWSHMTREACLFGEWGLVGRRMTRREDAAGSLMVKVWREMFPDLDPLAHIPDDEECVGWQELSEWRQAGKELVSDWLSAKFCAVRLQLWFMDWMRRFRAVRLHYVEKYLCWFNWLLDLDFQQQRVLANSLLWS